MRRALAAAGVIAAAALGSAPVWALATPDVASAASGRPGIALLRPVRDVDPLQNAGKLGFRPDRLLKSVVPGPVVNTEQLTVGVGPTGAPAVVTDLQQLVITAPGNYIVRELGPARRTEALGDTVPPVLELGQVVWQGFSPGRRTLQARLTLDPAIEAHRLPMSVRLVFRDARGRPHVLGPGGRVPVAGTLSVTITNVTGAPRVIGLGIGDAGPLGADLDLLYAAARAPRAAVPPYAGAGLATTLAGSYRGDEQISISAPLRVTGSIGVSPGTAQVRGPGTTPTSTGADVAGTLDGSASFDLDVSAGQQLRMDLDARPWLDPRSLDPRTVVPPAASWPAWARSRPDAGARQAATTTLAEAAAAAARAAEYSPYLQADTPGTDLSTFRYVVAPESATPRAGDVIRAKPAAITAAAFALVAIAGNAALLWRQV
jgi:hypothetical protein